MTIHRILPARLVHALDVLRRRIDIAQGTIEMLRQEIDDTEALIAEAVGADAPAKAVSTLFEELIDLREQLVAGLAVIELYDDIALRLAEKAGMTMEELQESWAEDTDQE